MGDWNGYPQHPDAHPERPWWRRYQSPIDGAWGWTRHGGNDSPVIRDDATPEWMIAWPDEAEAWLLEQMASWDTSHPLPPPEPRCGQVWVSPGGAESMVQMVYLNGAGTRTIDLPDHHFFWPPDPPERPNSCWGSAPETLTTANWPPPGAVLVAGPGAPWAPMGGDDGR